MKIFKNIFLIIKESYRWRNRPLVISTTESEAPELNIKKAIFNNTVGIILFSIIVFFFQNIINSELAGYLINALSIFIGLFTSVLILFFDKYLIHKANMESKPIANESMQIEKIKVKNFSEKFVYITLETILIAVFLIALLSSPLVFGDFFKEDFRTYNIKVGFNQTIIFLGLVIVAGAKIFTLLFFYKLIIRLLFIFGSLGEYMFSIFNNKIKNI